MNVNAWKLSTALLGASLVVVVAQGRTTEVRAAEVERQPHMKAALVNLEQALGALNRATADKGGHRAKAIELTTAAIAETRKGMAFDNKN